MCLKIVDVSTALRHFFNFIKYVKCFVYQIWLKKVNKYGILYKNK